MTDEKIRALVDEAREALRRCTFDSGADHAKLHDAFDSLEALTVPDGDARERLAEIIWDAWDERDCVWSELSEVEKSRWRSVANAILAAFPVLSRAVAPEPLPVGGESDGA